MMYQNELDALHKAHRFRSKKMYDEEVHDFSSNDYLGFAQIPSLFERAVTQVSMHKFHAPKASLLVNGYHPIHEEFEAFLTRNNGFESALVCGSGFLANFSLIESLPRKKDILILDEEYHASGIIASKTLDAKVLFFRHNDANHLETLIQTTQHHRVIVAVEGIYSMSGDLLNPDIFEVATRHDAILIVDEAHSVGVVGENLLGVFELYGITPSPNHIKMGTLGKALGSYGAYILCSEHIAQYLQNRAKAIIYTTAPSLFDIALGHQGFLYILKNAVALKAEITQRQAVIGAHFNHTIDGLIFACPMREGADVVLLQQKLVNQGFLVGAIRPPTVIKPILRIIPRLGESVESLQRLCSLLKEEIQ